jgi:hypothetical protein
VLAVGTDDRQIKVTAIPWPKLVNRAGSGGIGQDWAGLGEIDEIRRAHMDWGPLAGWIAVIPSGTSAVVAVSSAKRSKKDARDIRDALTLTVRPIFALSVTPGHRSLDEQHGIQIGLGNVSSYPVIDVRVVVTNIDGQELGVAEGQRLEPRTPGTMGSLGNLRVDLHRLANFQVVGDKQVITVTVRSSDHLGLQRWEQRGTVTREVKFDEQAKKTYVILGQCRHGEPVKYKPVK